MPVAGNYLHQELALLTGAVDLMVVDVQCVMPSLPQVAACHHTKVVTTSRKAHVPGAERIEFDPHERQAGRAGRLSRARWKRLPGATPRGCKIPRQKMDLVAGFTNENLPQYLGGRFRSGYRPLIDAVAAGRIRGVVGVVGCNTPRDRAGQLSSGPGAAACWRRTCWWCRPGAAPSPAPRPGCCGPRPRWNPPGRGLREVCAAVGIPPVLHVGSCVDNSRILSVCVALVAEGGIGRRHFGAAHRRGGPRGHEREGHHHRAVRGGFRDLHRVLCRRRAWREAAWCASTWKKTSSAKPAAVSFSPTTSRRPRAGIVAHLDAKRKALNLAPMLYQDGVKSIGVAARSLSTYLPPTGLASLGCGKAQEQSQSRPPEE